MEDISLHILDIAENSIAAHARTVEIRIEENTADDLFVLDIVDDGKGMTEEEANKALDPFYTTKKTRRFGFGLSLLRETAKMADGDFSLASKPGKGTSIRASFQMSHIDARPLGSIPDTMATLIMGNPDVDFVYSHKFDSGSYSLDTREIKNQLGDIPINSPEVITLLRNKIKEELDHIRRKK
jgi:hypothetical protein